MKKALLAGIIVVAIAAAAWSAIWFAGRSQIEDRLDLEVARAEARGIRVTWEDRVIAGFPLGYEVRATGVAVTELSNGLLVRIPQMVSRVDASDVDLLDTVLGGEITVDLPIPERRREMDPTLPKVLLARITGDDMRIHVTGLTAEAPQVGWQANTVRMAIDQPDLPNTLDLEIVQMDGQARRSGSMLTSGLQAQQLVFRMDGEDVSGLRSEVEVMLDALSVTTRSDAVQGNDISSLLFAGGDGSAELVYTIGRTATRMDARHPTEETGGRFGYAGTTSTGVITVAGGVIEARGDSRQNQWTFDPVSATSPLRGTVEVETLQGQTRFPTAPTEDLQDSAMTVELLGVTGDELFWSTLDPGARLDRAKSEFSMDIEATAKLTSRIDQLAPHEPFPLQFSNVSVNRMDLAALGAKIQASGDVEVLQPLNLPLGEVKIGLENATPTLQALTEAGLLDEGLRQMAGAMLQIYARDVGDGRHETELSFGNQGMTVNGLPIQ